MGNIRKKIIISIVTIILAAACVAFFVKESNWKNIDYPRAATEEQIIPGNEPVESDTTIAVEQEEKIFSYVNPQGITVSERFNLPAGYHRVEYEADSFAYFLQHLPLKPDGTKVKYFNGKEKPDNAYLAVVDYSLGDRDLQQCADSVIRLRAEYLYDAGRKDEITFHFVNGFEAAFSKWAQGYGIHVSGNEVFWVENISNDGSFESLQRYLEVVYAYASTLSLEQELISKDVSAIEIGDVFIIGGSPGHCVIVVDVAMDSEGQRAFMLAQGYMPAQDIQILRGGDEDSPWYFTKDLQILNTPEYTFTLDQLKTW